MLLFSLVLNFSLTFAHAQTISSEAAAKALGEMYFYSGRAGMHLSPNVMSKYDLIHGIVDDTVIDDAIFDKVYRKWGIQNHKNKLVGIRTIQDGDVKVGVLGCVACHSGKAAGKYIVGIGNKNIDPGQIGIDGLNIQKRFKNWTDFLDEISIKKKTKEFRQIEDSSLALMAKLADPRMSAETQGLVPVSLVGSWFYEMAGTGIPNHGYIGATKVPTWFGFEKKVQIGQFADGIGKGHPPGWIVGVEVAAGQSAHEVRKYFSKVEEAANLISALKPPKYPFAINVIRAARGKTVFEQTCAKCHGTYEFAANGDPIYKEPKIIPLEKIGTDPDRLDYVTDDFLNKVRSSPLSDLIQLTEYAGKRMYIAPRLHGIWARFPYLHNASVPTLRDLLEPAAKRPKIFSLEDAGERERFDSRRVGLKVTKDPEEIQELREAREEGDRSVYSTDLHGQSNQGHEKFVDLPATDKDAIVEYLKTL